MNLSLLVKNLETAQRRTDLPNLTIGDTLNIGVLIQEGNKQRVQNYQGTLIAQHRAGVNSTITVRRVFQGIGRERIFLIHSPSVQRIEVVRRAHVRRAKLYYLRDRVGKATRLKERFETRPELFGGPYSDRFCFLFVLFNHVV
jgi:large subunit ribosomal protein L19